MHRKVLGGWLLSTLGLLAACHAPEARPADALVKEIARLEDRRTLGPERELLALLKEASPLVRARAATAVGRLQEVEGRAATTAKLVPLLDDRDEGVRAAAAFALGMRGDASWSSTLIQHATGVRADHSPLVRAQLVEAASKLEEPASLSQYLGALDDASPEVRLEAAAGAARWKTDTKAAASIDARLCAFVAKESDLLARTYGLFALERRKSAAGREVFLKSARAAEPEERLFAVRGLATLAEDSSAFEMLTASSADADWRVAVEALRGLAKNGSPKSLEAIAAATRNESPHVRAAAFEAANSQADAILKNPDRRQDFADFLFQTEETESSVAVRCAAIPIARRIDMMGLARSKTSPQEWASAIRAWGRPDGWDSLSSFLKEGGLIREESTLLEREAFVEAIAAWHTDEADARLVLCMSSPDNGMRLAAVTALLEREKPEVEMEALRQCYATSRGEVSREVRFNVLKLAVKVGGKEVPYLLKSGLSDEDAYVRRVAHDELAKLTGKPVVWVEPPLPEVELAFVGEGVLDDPRPHVVIVTDRGEMEFELFADEAPEHVANFLKHAEPYKGTTFHRVVSDFVVQGGDPRGDGNGGSSWRGDALRHEIGPRKYVRGSLGMPRNEDWDSGGSQLFVTHRRTPHLDGRYTIFGELVKGGDVLDALDLGDKILEVRRLPRAR